MTPRNQIVPCRGGVLIDLVDEASWEDRFEAEGLFLSLEAAGLEEDTRRQPLWGLDNVYTVVEDTLDGDEFNAI